MVVHLVYPQVQASWLDFQLSLEEVEPTKYMRTQDPFLVFPSCWIGHFLKCHNTLCLSLQNFSQLLLLFSLGTTVSPRRKWKQCVCKFLGGQIKSIMVFLKVAYVLQVTNEPMCLTCCFVSWIPASWLPCGWTYWSKHIYPWSLLFNPFWIR